MLQPKKYYPRLILRQRGQGTPPNYCKNPKCGAKIPRKKSYCDSVCRQEHSTLMKLARRPAEIHCAQCGKSIDVLARAPGELKNRERHFCDGICMDAWRRANGRYEEMSRAGNQANRTYKEKHGFGYNHEERAKAVSLNNQTRPPRAKLHRSGMVWGYKASIVPNAARDGYIAHLPELPEAGTVEAKTAKEALRQLRARFAENRKNIE